MGTEAHDIYTDRLSDYIDGELDAREQADVERHLAQCASCRLVLNELRAVAARAAALVDSAPGQDLWAGVAARIGADDRRVTRLVPRRRFSFTLPQLAAAGIALMVLSGGMVWLAKTGDPRVDFPPVSGNVAIAPGSDAAPTPSSVAPVMFADPQFDGAVEDLERILEAGRNRLDPETIRVLEQNLATIDAAIDQSRQALQKDPANTFLNNHLAAAQQRKLALLRRATALTAGS
jgi:hypothetical protein